MPLPVALLIACYKHKSISNEIREIIGEKVSVMESLSCQCRDPNGRLRLVPPSSCCSSDRTTPVSDNGSEKSYSSSGTKKSYSYFSDINDMEEALYGDSGRQSVVDIGRCLSALVDLVENVTVRFNQSYIFKEDEIKISYEKRDILDLGRNIQGHFPLRHPVLRKIQAANPPRALSVPRSCPINDCDFQDILPISLTTV